MSQLSIRIPISQEQPSFRAPCNPVRPNYYANWTVADYECEYSDANETRFTWDNVIVRMRRPRRVKVPLATQATQASK